MGSRLYNPRLLQCYRIDQIAELYGCYKNTVGNWLRQGLRALDDERPVLVHGSALNDFHAAREAKAKRPCGPGKLYCLPCRRPHRPAGDIVEYVGIAPNLGKLRAICAGCDRLLFQRVNERRLTVFRALMDVADAKA